MRLIRKLFKTPVAGAMPAATATAWAPTHQHSKGGMYRVLGRGILEATHEPMVIYDDVEGTIWIRPVVEFDDGRFSAIA